MGEGVTWENQYVRGNFLGIMPNLIKEMRVDGRSVGREADLVPLNDMCRKRLFLWAVRAGRLNECVTLGCFPILAVVIKSVLSGLLGSPLDRTRPSMWVPCLSEITP